MDNIYHALHVMRCDPSVTLRIYEFGKTIASYDISLEDTLFVIRPYVSFEDPPQEAIHAPMTLYELMNWIEFVVNSGTVSHVCLNKNIHYKDNCLTFRDACRIIVWDAPSN